MNVKIIHISKLAFSRSIRPILKRLNSQSTQRLVQIQIRSKLRMFTCTCTDLECIRIFVNISTIIVKDNILNESCIVDEVRGDFLLLIHTATTAYISIKMVIF